MTEVKLVLNENEAEWLAACMGMVMQLSRHWDSSISLDYGNAILAKTTLARIIAAQGKDPDQWLQGRQAG